MRLLHFIGRFIDYPSAIAGALLMGCIVALINSDHGLWPATTAALKQAAYTFFFGGMLIKFLYSLAVRIKHRISGVVISTIAVSLLTILLVFLLHSMKGTPKSLESTIPTIILAPPGFLVLAWRKRYKTSQKLSPNDNECRERQRANDTSVSE